MRKRYVKMKSQTASKFPDLRAKETLLPNPEISEHFFEIQVKKSRERFDFATLSKVLLPPSVCIPNYEKHPLLGAADRATLYAFVARKQPQKCRFRPFSCVLSHFCP